MNKSVYIKPSTRIVELQNETDFMVAASAGYNVTPSSGLNDSFTFGGQSDGSHEINAKRGGGVWGFDEED